ncbi:hypothetical protein GGF50DRAFT_121525 [Schizophyllum commune]
MTIYSFTDPHAQLSSNAHHRSTPNALTTFYVFLAIMPTPTIRDGHLPLAAIVLDVALILLSSMRAQQARRRTSVCSSTTEDTPTTPAASTAHAVLAVRS